MVRQGQVQRKARIGNKRYNGRQEKVQKQAKKVRRETTKCTNEGSQAQVQREARSGTKEGKKRYRERQEKFKRQTITSTKGGNERYKESS